MRHARLSNPAIDVAAVSGPSRQHPDHPARRTASGDRQSRPVAALCHPDDRLGPEVSLRLAAGGCWEKDFKNLHPAPFGCPLCRAIFRLFDAAWSARIGTESRHSCSPLARAPGAGVTMPVGWCQSAGRFVGWLGLRKMEATGQRRNAAGFVDIPVVVSATPDRRFASF